MAKKEPEKLNESKNIDFKKTGDALDPRPAPWGYIARLHVPVVVLPSGELVARLGIVADVPLLAWATKAWPDIVPAKQIFSPGDEVVVVIKNPSAVARLELDAGEPVVCLHPLLFG